MRHAIKLVCAVLFLGLAQNLVAQSTADCRLQRFPAPNLCGRAGLDTVPASYLFLVDESGSMRPLWPGVRAALSDFAGAVPDRSELDVRLFATTVRGHIPATISTAETQRNWYTQLTALAEPRGAFTDLGLAAQAAIDRLSSAPAGQLQFVFLLTDGAHDPGPGSPYPTSWNTAWQELANRAAQLQQARPLQVGIVRLAPAADLTLLSRVFAGAVVTDAMSAPALRDWFANLSREAAAANLRLLLAEDLKRPAATVSAEGALRTYQGRSVRQQVTFHTDRRILSSVLPAGLEIPLPGGGTLTFSEEVRLEPGEKRAALVEIVDRAYPVFLPPGTRKREVAATVPVGGIRSEPAAELGHLGVPAKGESDIALDFQLAGGGSLSWSLWIAVLLLLLSVAIAIVVWSRWKLHRAYLSGRVIVRHADVTAVAQEETVLFKGRKVRVHTITLPGEHGTLSLEARSERGKTVVYASAHGEGISCAGKRMVAPIPVKRVVRFESGSSEITYYPN